MTKHCNIFAILIFFAVKAYSYDVVDGKRHGYKVTADNLICLITPQGKRIQISDYPFTGINNGYSYSDPPVKPIICSWAPKGRWLAIFLPLQKITTIYLVNLQLGEQLKTIGPPPNFPKFYGKHMVSSFTRPVRWKNNILYLDEQVNVQDGDKKHYAAYFVIHDNTFRLVFEDEFSKSTPALKKGN